VRASDIDYKHFHATIITEVSPGGLPGVDDSCLGADNTKISQPSIVIVAEERAPRGHGFEDVVAVIRIAVND
jgi:hypothetical protein